MVTQETVQYVKITYLRNALSPITPVCTMKKWKRGSFQQAVSIDDNFIIVLWIDNSVVSIASNAIGVAPMQSGTHYSEQIKKDARSKPHIL